MTIGGFFSIFFLVIPWETMGTDFVIQAEGTIQCHSHPWTDWCHVPSSKLHILGFIHLQTFTAGFHPLIADNYRLDLRPSLGVLSPNQMNLWSHFKIAISVMTHFTVSSLASALYNISSLGFKLSKAIWDELSVYENKLRHVGRTELTVAVFSSFLCSNFHDPDSSYLDGNKDLIDVVFSPAGVLGQGWQRILNPCNQQNEDPLNWRWRPEILHGVELGSWRRPKPSIQLSKINLITVTMLTVIVSRSEGV